MKLQLTPYPDPQLIPRGKVYTFEVTMAPYEDGRTRTVRVWTPAGYDGVRRFPVLYMHDGQNLFADSTGRPKWEVDAEMSKLPDADQAIIVGVDSFMPTRFSELDPPCPRDEEGQKRLPPMMAAIEPTGDKYAAFIVDTLKPLIDENFLTLPDKAHTGIGGSSMGGLESFYMALRYPEVFTKAIVFSPAFLFNNPKYILEQMDAYDWEKVKDTRFYLYNGYEALDKALTDDALAVFRKMRDEKGLDNRHVVFILDTREPHFETAWRHYFHSAVKYLFCEDNSTFMPVVPPRRPGGPGGPGGPGRPGGFGGPAPKA